MIAGVPDVLMSFTVAALLMVVWFMVTERIVPGYVRERQNRIAPKIDKEHLDAMRELDEIDRVTGMDQWPHWQPLAKVSESEPPTLKPEPRERLAETIAELERTLELAEAKMRPAVPGVASIPFGGAGGAGGGGWSSMTPGHCCQCTETHHDHQVVRVFGVPDRVLSEVRRPSQDGLRTEYSLEWRRRWA